MTEPGAETAYLFRHALVRAGAYELQLPQDRAALHALAVDVLEELLDSETLDSAALELADHAHAAAQLEGKAERYLQAEARFLGRAHAHSRRRYAHGNVIGTGRRLLEHPYGVAETRSELARTVGFAHMHQGEMQDAINSFQQAAVHALSDEQRGRALMAEADIYRNMTRFTEAEKLFREALECLPEGHADHAVVLRQLATLYLMQGQVPQGEELMRQALQASLAAGDTSSAARCEANLGVVMMRTGRPAEAEQAFVRAGELAEKAGDRTTVALANENLGALLAQTGRMQDFETCFQLAMEQARQLGDRPLLASILTDRGHALTEAERFSEAETAMRDAIELHRETRNLGKLATTLGNLGVLYFRTGRKAEALRLTRESLAMHQASGDAGAECVGRLNLSDTLFEDGDFEEALRELERAALLAEQVRDPRLQGYTVCHRVMTLARRDNVAPDQAEWRRGIEFIRQSGDLAAIGRLEAELRERFPGTPDRDGQGD
ncbi:MAG: tetratricopeptide repeat protein [Planctomycetota bacterium]|nr:tetratricopeptide repeat protein [Planctomycetota bacterium]